MRWPKVLNECGAALMLVSAVTLTAAGSVLLYSLIIRTMWPLTIWLLGIGLASGACGLVLICLSDKADDKQQVS